ncbi:unnamed protein product [Penicillium camemberti]|uniref:Str. FM013 n=1 Tax=Penicillium camemberti (strain FM 013) TaxID=1429867 RepID=A0A0G4PN68_PENC3|nr:unnamed protein product [Penicillium camemberti]
MASRPFSPLRNHEVPWILFRTSCDGEGCESCRKERPRSFDTSCSGLPTLQQFDSHLSWEKTPTQFTSFFSTWTRAMGWRGWLEREGHTDIKVVALWSRDMGDVYEAKPVVLHLRYKDNGPDRRRKPRHHENEYLIHGGVLDEYRILAVFRGGGDLRWTTFKCDFYEVTASVPSGYFVEQGKNPLEQSPLKQLEDEIFRNTGLHDDIRRDQLVKSISDRNFPKPMVYKRARFPTQLAETVY